jgi:uncharacterized protein YfdQ (DUF2303 family)
MTYRELIQTMNIISQNIGQQETKTQKKLFKIYERLKKYHEEYQEQFQEIRLDAALVDDKGALVLDEKGEYKFTKDGVRQVEKAVKELLAKDFAYTKIEVLNANGLEHHTYLKDWLIGVEFISEEDAEIL